MSVFHPRPSWRDRRNDPNEDPMTPDYRERIAPTNDRTLDARVALARAWRMLLATEETDAATRIDAIGTATFGAEFNTTTTVPFSATGETLVVLARAALARAWELLVAASEETAADQVKVVGGDVWGVDVFQDAITDAIQTACELSGSHGVFLL